MLAPLFRAIKGHFPKEVLVLVFILSFFSLQASYSCILAFYSGNISSS